MLCSCGRPCWGCAVTPSLRWLPAAHCPGRSKTRTERRGEPAFSTLVEVLSRSRWRVHMSVARSVDDMLAGRWEDGEVG